MIDPLLVLFGIFTGFTAGFFGIGGGMVIVPLLLYANYTMKEAISISIVQMVFSSIYGTFLNLKKNLNLLNDGLMLGLGGFCGGILSGIVVSYLSNQSLQYIFIFILFLSIAKLFQSANNDEHSAKETKKVYLFLIGMFIGVIAMSIGVGGSIMLTPLLVSFMGYNLKIATSLGLFFVVFSSIAGFISLSMHGHMMAFEGSIVGIASLIGVYVGIKVKHVMQLKSYKKLILSFYMIIFILMIKKVFF